MDDRDPIGPQTLADEKPANGLRNGDDPVDPEAVLEAAPKRAAQRERQTSRGDRRRNSVARTPSVTAWAVCACTRSTRSVVRIRDSRSAALRSNSPRDSSGTTAKPAAAARRRRSPLSRPTTRQRWPRASRPRASRSVWASPPRQPSSVFRCRTVFANTRESTGLSGPGRLVAGRRDLRLRKSAFLVDHAADLLTRQWTAGFDLGGDFERAFQNLHLPQTGVLEVDGEGSEHGQHETMHALEEPQADDVHLEEADDRASEDLQRPGPLPLPVEPGGPPLAVDLNLSPVLPEGAERVMLERVPKHRQRPRQDDLGVHFAILVARLIATKQSNHLVGAPAAVPDPPAEEMIGAENPVSVVARSGREQLLDLLTKPGRHALIGIDEEDPFMGGLRDGPVLLSGRIDVFVLQHPGAELARDAHGGVGRERIDDQDFVGEPNRQEAVAQRGLLVEGRHDRGERRSPRAHPFLSLRASLCCDRS